MRPQRLFIVMILMPLPAGAGTSAHYTLEPDTLDGGGQPGSSANYTANFSAAPGGAGGSLFYMARGGFAGQLSDATAIDITASPPTVKEGATRLLSASLVLDDLSRSRLAAGSVIWNVESGPIAGISAIGLATAAAVYEDTVAMVRGTHLSFTDTLNLTVVNTLPDNFGSYAGDGMADDWQVLYFGIGNPAADPFVDADGDGYDNLFEYRACLVPTDPLSVFSMSIAEVSGGGHAVTFSPRLDGCTYTLMGSSNLSLWNPVAGTTTDAGAVRTILDPAGTGNRRFYFISVERP